jgi:hypothetical protein
VNLPAVGHDNECQTVPSALPSHANRVLIQRVVGGVEHTGFADSQSGRKKQIQESEIPESDEAAQ